MPHDIQENFPPEMETVQGSNRMTRSSVKIEYTFKEPPDPMRELASRMRRRDMSTELRPLTRETAELASSWLADPNIAKWLDFGERQHLTAQALYFMSRSPAHVIRTTHGQDKRMFGIVGLYGISNMFKTAMLWGIRPRLRPPVRANGAMELRQLLKIGFEERGLASIYSNIVETNRASLAVTAEAGFKMVGRRRAAHIIDGFHWDRVVFDIIATEYFEQEARLQRYFEEERGKNELPLSSSRMGVPAQADETRILALAGE